MPAVAKAAEPVERDRARQAVLGLTLVELGRHEPPQRRVVEPAQREQGALDTSHLAQRRGEAVLMAKGRQLFQDDRGRDGPALQGRDHPADVVPMRADQIRVESLAEQRCQLSILRPRLACIKPTIQHHHWVTKVKIRQASRRGPDPPLTMVLGIMYIGRR